MTPAEFAKHWLERCATLCQVQGGEPWLEIDYRLAAKLIESDRAAVREATLRELIDRLGGGARGTHVASAATRLLWVDGLPMPPFDATATREEILEALRAELPTETP